MRTIILLLVAAFCCAGAGAQVPRQVNYQGYLTDAGGTPINATLPMAFKLYDAASGGTALYGETQTVTVTAGVFNALVGAVTPLTLPFDKPYWLGLTVGAEVVEMVPRQPLAASPYALRAVSAEVLAATATVPGSQVSGALAGATLPAGNLTGTIAPGNLPASQQLPAIACVPAQIPKWNGSAWACAADDSGGIAGGDVGQVLTGTGAAPAWTGSPALGGSLTLANPSTATTGSIMKGGNRFLHNFGPGNTFVGENAGNFALSGGNNTGAGGNALLSNTSGEWNTAHGFQALALNHDGSANTAIGMQALFYNASGSGNTAVGLNALLNTTGSSNIAVGSGAGSGLTGGSDNVAIGNPGAAGESGTMRLGSASQTRTFIAGVRGVTPGNADGLAVVIDSNGQLGTHPASLDAFQGTPCTVSGIASTVTVSTDATGRITFKCGNLMALQISYNYGQAPPGSGIEAGIGGTVLGGVPADPPGSPRFGCGGTFPSSPLPCTALMQIDTPATVFVADSHSSGPFRLICPDGSSAVVEDRVTYWYAQCSFTMNSDKSVSILRP